MGSDEDVTRRLLRGAAPGHQGVAVETVARAVDRRRRRRARIAIISAPLLTAATVGGALLGVTWIDPGERQVPVATATPTPSTGGPIPWIATPATAYEPMARETAPQCAASDLTPSGGPIEESAGHVYRTNEIVNDGDTACSLQGYPGVVAREPGLSDIQAEVLDLTQGEPRMVILQPGESTALYLETALRCEGGSEGDGQPARYYRVDVTLEDGDILRVPIPNGLDLTCGLRASAFSGNEETLVGPTVEPWRDLGVTVQAGDSRIVDGFLVYVVSLTNYGADDLSLSDRCPSYVETLTSEPSGNLTAKASYLLNCTDTSTIPAGATVAFEMKLPLPDGVGGSPMTLSWSLAGPDLPSGRADVVVADVPDELLPRTIDELPVGMSSSFLYRAHCGVEWLYVGAEVWRTELRDDGSHNPPSGWPEMIAGTLTRTNKDRITFTSDDIPEVLVFKPAPAAADPGECN